MDEYVCVTVVSRPDESTEAFSARLSQFWTHMLRNYKPDFEQVYAETAEFERTAGRWSRQYLATLDVTDRLETELESARLEYRPIDREDLYSKYEAVAPEWMQIEH